jgi:hypothetical protein
MDPFQQYLTSLGIDPGLFRNFGANEITAEQMTGYTPTMGDYGQGDPMYQNVGLSGLQGLYNQYSGNLAMMPQVRMSAGDRFGSMDKNYGMDFDPQTGSFSLKVKSGDKEAAAVPYKQDASGQWVPDWQAAKAVGWDTNRAVKKDLMGMGTVLGAAALGTGAAYGGLFGPEAAAAFNAGGAAGSATGAAAAGGAIPGMSAGGWGVMDASLMAPGAFEAAMAAAPAAGVAGATGAGGTSAAAGGAASGLPASTGATSGGGMGSFLPSTLGEWGSTIGSLLPAIGAVGGALQGSQNQTVTNQTQLPPWLQALGPQLTNAAVNAANQPFQPYGGTRIEPFNPNQQAAFGMTQQRATQGSPVERAGQDAAVRAATGNANPMFGLDNPYLNKQIDAAVGDVNRNFNKTVVPQLDAMNVRANTGFGTSSGMDEMRGEAYRNLNETTGKLANDMRYKDYYTQAQLGEGMAGRQLQAAGLAPNLGAMDYRNIDALLGVGNQQQQLGQQGQDFNYSEFMRQLQYPDLQMQRLGYPFGFNQGQTSTTTTPGVGAWAGGISGLLGGIGMGNMMGGGTAVSNAATMTPPPRTTLSNGTNGYGLDGYYPYAWGGA